MPRLILKCPYLKSGTQRSSSHLSNLVKYMATREGTEKLNIENINLATTANQQKLINQIIKKLPNTKNLFEYEDYLENKTAKNASEFISIALEQNLDKIGKRKNYVDYIANRPRVEKVSSHGLFTSGNEKIVLSKVAEEIANHQGNVWTPIISLKREDAVKTGFDNAESWHNMLSYLAPTIAESLKIPIQNFRWYAAFHNESHHPHVHMICYCVNPRDGFLTKKGIEKMKSGLVKNIFKNEMQEIYLEQTKRRDNLKSKSKKMMLKLISEMKTGTIQNDRIEVLFLELAEKLKHTKGKKVYGYLQPSIKNIVDEIVDELSTNTKIDKAYKLWYEMRNEILHSYMDELPEPLPLSKQKEFKSIKNMIISEADKLQKGEISFDEIENENIVLTDDISELDNTILYDYEPTEDESINQNVYVKWTDEYKKAREFLFGNEDNEPDFKKALELMQKESKNGNALATFDVGRIYADGLGIEIDEEKAGDYYAEALCGFQDAESKKTWKYTEYRIGKMYAGGLGTDQDYEKAAYWFKLSADKKYKYAQYSLGNLYYRGQGVEQNFETAFDLYLKSAKQGFPYAHFEVAKMYRDGVGTEKNEDKSNIHFKQAFMGFEILEKQSHDDKLQYRLGWMLQNGIGTKKDILSAKRYFEKSAKLGNTFACYSLAKIILAQDNSSDKEIQKALEYLQTASDDGNEFAQYCLAKIYLEGNYTKKNIEKAIKLFTSSAEQGNEWAAYKLGILYLKNEDIPKDTAKAISFLKISADKNNEWANYQLGKLYLLGEEVLKDTEKAVLYLTKSADQGNQFAQYILGQIYLFGDGTIAIDKETAIKWFTLSAEQGNEYARFFLEKMDKFKDPSVAFFTARLFHHMSRIFENNIPLDKSDTGLKIDSKLLRKLKQKKIASGHKRNDHEQNLQINI